MEPLRDDEPRSVGPYRPLAELGRGGMGRVLLASDADGALVALKLVLPHLLRDEEFRYRFRREVLTSREAASGPCTAAVIDADEHAAQPWLASEFFFGPTLAEALAACGPLDERSVLHLAAGLRAALDQIHGIGVLHRDLKPSNVLLTEDGVRLIDFGIARAPGSGGDYTLTTTGALIGAPPYMSPEQITGGELTPKSDVFSLGTTLLTACTGVNPFDTGNQFQTLNQVVNTEPDLAALPPRLRRIVEPCMRKDPAARPDAAALADLIGQVPAEGPPWPQGVRDLDLRQREAVASLARSLGCETTVRQSDKRVRFTPGAVGATTATPTVRDPGRTGAAARPLAALRALLAVALTCLLIVAGVAALADGNDDPADGADPATAAADGLADEDAEDDYDYGDYDEEETTGYDPPEPEPDPIADAEIGDCFYDHGDETEADLEPASYCDSGTFEVVDLHRGTTDLDACDSADRLSTSVSYASHDLVLCLSYRHSMGDAYHARPGECVFGPDDDTTPWYVIDCQTGAFEVLERLPGEHDMDLCTDSTYYNHAYSFTTSEDYLDVVLCMSMIYPDDMGYASQYDCMRMSGGDADRRFAFADCDSANTYVTGRTGEYNATGFCGDHGWTTWQSPDFPAHAYTVCWQYT